MFLGRPKSAWSDSSGGGGGGSGGDWDPGRGMFRLSVCIPMWPWSGISCVTVRGDGGAVRNGNTRQCQIEPCWCFQGSQISQEDEFKLIIKKRNVSSRMNLGPAKVSSNKEVCPYLNDLAKYSRGILLRSSNVDWC